MGGLAHGVARQLRWPQGALGRLAGAGMRIVNRQPNALAIEALDVRAESEVLEIGFGPGEGIRALARLTPRGRVFGIDQSSTMLSQASALNRAAIRDGHVRLALCGFEETGLADSSVDRILAVNVAYFWSDGPRVLAELHRVLRPGGRISIYVTDVSTMRRWPFAASGHHRLFDAGDLATFLADGPFDASAIAVERVTMAGGVQGLIGLVGKA